MELIQSLNMNLVITLSFRLNNEGLAHLGFLMCWVIQNQPVNLVVILFITVITKYAAYCMPQYEAYCLP